MGGVLAHPGLKEKLIERKQTYVQSSVNIVDGLRKGTGDDYEDHYHSFFNIPLL